LLIIYLRTQQHYLKQEVKSYSYSGHKVTVIDLNEIFTVWLDELRERNQQLLLKYVQKKKLGLQEKIAISGLWTIFLPIGRKADRKILFSITCKNISRSYHLRHTGKKKGKLWNIWSKTPEIF